MQLEALLRRGIRRFNVPGASLAVLHGGRLKEVAAGVLNLDTGVPVTTDSLFQIGSITKVFTASLVMQLVDEGRVGLDQPVRELVPGFAVADRSATEGVTVRHLLTHTSGIEGDLFMDTGTGLDAAEALIRLARFAPQLFPVGERMSYCNFGFAVLGRIVECVTGTTWDQAMRQRLFKPLAMTRALTRPEDALRFRCAMGHVPDPKRPAANRTAPRAWLSFGQRAAGATPMMSAADLMKFVRLHLDSGLTRDGMQVLSRRSVRAMQARQVKLTKDAPRGMSHWGLGWFLGDWQGGRVFGHDGATFGQFAFLRVHAPSGTAVALLTNGGDAGGLAEQVFGETFEPLARVTRPVLPQVDPQLRIAPESVVGRYQRLGGWIDISHDGARFFFEQGVRDPELGGAAIAKQPIAFARRHVARFVTKDPVLARNQLNFEGGSADRPAFVGFGTRLYPRVSA